MDLPGYGHAGGGEKAQREFAALTALYFGARTGRRSGRTRTAAPPECRPRCARGRPRGRRAPPRPGERHRGAAAGSTRSASRSCSSATKADKLSQSEKAKLKRACLEAFGEEPLPVSAITGDGLDELWQRMRELTAELSAAGSRLSARRCDAALTATS